MMLRKVVILLSIVMMSCNSDDNKEIKTLLINSFKVPCTGVAPMSCLQVKESAADNNWSNFYNTIEGFNFETGFLYTIEVAVESVPEDQIVADGSSLKYSLLKVVDKVRDAKLSINDIWVLQTIEGESIVDSFDKLPYLEIHVSRNTYMGNDGCNTFNGSLKTIEETLIDFEVSASTDMTCLNDDLSLKFMKNLGKTNSYQIDKGTLTLLDNEKALLTFKKVD